MPLAPVSPTATKLAGLYTDPFTLQNQGSGVVYVGLDSSISATSYEFALAVGQTLGFQGGMDLWLVCAAGQSATVNYMTGALNTFSPAPSTVTVLGTVAVSGTVQVAGTVAISGGVTINGTVPISGAVSITGPVAISGTVPISGTVSISGGVAVTGTVAISGPVTVSGSVTVAGNINVTNSTLNIGGTVASLAQANPIVLDSFVYLTLPAAINATIHTAVLNIASYSSIAIFVDVAAGGSNPGTNGWNVTNYFDLSVIQTASGLTDAFGVYNPQWLYDNSTGGYFIIFPVVAPQLQLILSFIKAATTFTSQVNFTVLGLSTITPNAIYSSRNNGSLFADDILAKAGVLYRQFLGSTGSTPMSSRNGLAYVQVLNTSTGSTGFYSMSFADSGAIQGLGGLALNGLALGDSRTLTYIFPMRPILMSSSISAGNFSVSITQNVQ